MQGIHVLCLLQIVKLPWFNKMRHISLTIGPVHLLCKTLSRNRDTFLLNELYWCDAFLQNKFSLISVRLRISLMLDFCQISPFCWPWTPQSTWLTQGRTLKKATNVTEQAEKKAVGMEHSGKTGTWLSPGYSIITEVQDLSLYSLWSLVV